MWTQSLEHPGQWALWEISCGILHQLTLVFYHGLCDPCKIPRQVKNLENPSYFLSNSWAPSSQVFYPRRTSWQDKDKFGEVNCVPILTQVFYLGITSKFCLSLTHILVWPVFHLGITALRINFGEVNCILILTLVFYLGWLAKDEIWWSQLHTSTNPGILHWEPLHLMW